MHILLQRKNWNYNYLKDERIEMVKKVSCTNILDFSKLSQTEGFKYYKMENNSFFADCITIPLEGAKMSFLENHTKFLAKGKFMKKHIVFLFVYHTKDENGRLGTHKIKTNTLFCINSTKSIYYSFTPGTKWVIFQIPYGTLRTFPMNIFKYFNTCVSCNRTEFDIFLKKIHYLLIHNKPLVAEELNWKYFLIMFLNSFWKGSTIKYFEDSKSLILADKIYKYLENHFEYTIYVNDIATSLGKSVRTLERAFKQLFGISMQEFIKIYRLHKAKYLILKHKKNYSLTDICYKVGFNHQSHFIKYYKEFFLELPSKTRVCS